MANLHIESLGIRNNCRPMGLLTALILGMQAYQDSDSAVPLDVVLMAIPFVMVACGINQNSYSNFTICRSNFIKFSFALALF